MPEASVIPATKAATSFSSTIPAASTALAATAARPELGPIEICRLVPNVAYSSAPAAAAYRPFCSGIPAIPAYPRFFGTISAATVTPATRSPRSHPRSYERSVATIGTKLPRVRRRPATESPMAAHATRANLENWRIRSHLAGASFVSSPNFGAKPLSSR